MPEACVLSLGCSSTTEANGNGSPSIAPSITFPVTVIFCARTEVMPRHMNTIHKSFLFIITVFCLNEIGHNNQNASLRHLNVRLSDTPSRKRFKKYRAFVTFLRQKDRKISYIHRIFVLIVEKTVSFIPYYI